MKIWHVKGPMWRFFSQCLRYWVLAAQTKQHRDSSHRLRDGSKHHSSKHSGVVGAGVETTNQSQNAFNCCQVQLFSQVKSLLPWISLPK